jgi:hypothetical protein
MAHDDADAAPENWVWDPAYLVCLRELKWVFVIFVVLLSWTIGVSYCFGYSNAGDDAVATTAGIPLWFCWGVAAPWAVATIVSIAFALLYMRDHEPPAESDDAETSPSMGAAK